MKEGAISEFICGRSNGFTSKREPYFDDIWVKENFDAADSPSDAKPKFSAFLDKNRLLLTTIEAIYEFNRENCSAQSIHIVDCGVYMGMFTIAAGLACEKAGIDGRIDAYEANPFLIDSIAANISQYGLVAQLHNFGVGRAAGILEFVHPKGRMIGGTLHDINSKKSTEFTSTSCSVVPLSAIIPDEKPISLIKLDIEGSEIDAFSSIAASQEQINNVFIVEFSPWQGLREIVAGLTYSEWLVNNFIIFDIASWAHGNLRCRVATGLDLDRVLEGKKRSFNTDLLLIPRGLAPLAQSLSDQFPIAN